MTVQNLIDSGKFGTVNVGGDTARGITKTFCCDLLSIAMGRAPEGCAWVTVMGNMNTLAVASLADAACVIKMCITDRSGLASLAFDGGHQSGFLAADKRACAQS